MSLRSKIGIYKTHMRSVMTCAETSGNNHQMPINNRNEVFKMHHRQYFAG